MAKTIKIVAKHNCTIYFTREPGGLSFDKRRIMKNQTLVLTPYASEKIKDAMIASILGERNVILKDGDVFVSTYSGDFNYNN